MEMLQSQEVFLATRLEARFHGADNEEAHLTMSPSRNVAFLTTKSRESQAKGTQARRGRLTWGFLSHDNSNDGY